MGRINLTKLERQALLGPFVVGCLLGAFAAYAVFAFASEHALQSGERASLGETTVDAAILFVVSVVATVGLLGVVPLAIRRLVLRRKGDA